MIERKSIGISQSETKQVLALVAHLRHIYQTVFVEGRLCRPIDMDHADLLICAASLRTLLFDDTGDPVLLSFVRQHDIDIRVETLEANLGLFLLSFYAPDEWHISNHLVDILIDPEMKADYPLNEVNGTLLHFVDGTGFEAPLNRPDIWTLRSDEYDGSIGDAPGIVDGGLSQWIDITRREVPISEWGNVRIGYLKKIPITRRGLITYVANKLGGVHYDAKRLPPDLNDAEQYRVLTTAYDWDNQAIMHAGLVMIGIACVEILRAPNVLHLLDVLGKFLQKRQERLLRGDRNLPAG